MRRVPHRACSTSQRSSFEVCEYVDLRMSVRAGVPSPDPRGVTQWVILKRRNRRPPFRSFHNLLKGSKHIANDVAIRWRAQFSLIQLGIRLT